MKRKTPQGYALDIIEGGLQQLQRQARFKTSADAPDRTEALSQVDDALALIAKMRAHPEEATFVMALAAFLRSLGAK